MKIMIYNELSSAKGDKSLLGIRRSNTMKHFKRLFNTKHFILLTAFMLLFVVAACSTNGDTNNDIAVSSVSVTAAGSATTITALGGTLQMSATVLPSDATNKNITWSVANGTGSATITTAGLLTAETDGIVTVTATSNATSSVKGTKVITISNQVADDMDARLTDIKVNGNSVLEFNPLTLSYVHVISDGVTSTPSVTAVKYETSSTVVIVNATNVASSDVVNRTTTITVTTSEDVEKVYYVIFETQAAPVSLNTAGDYVILAETGVSSATTSDITGDIGVSPSPASYITGFSLTLDSTGTFSTSSQVTGKIYSSDYTTPTPSVLTTASADVKIAYSDAAGRAANYTELYSGDLSGKTLTQGVYMFSNSVLINTDLTLTGSATDVWIFQIAGNLTMASDINIILAGGANAKNIVWQVADTVAIGSGSHFEGTILAMTNISMGTNSSINGRLYAQTAVTLDATTVVKSND